MKLITSYQLYIGMLTEDHVVPHTFSQEQNLSLTDTSHHAAMSNLHYNGPHSIEVATQASGNSKLYLMIFRKIAISQPDLISN